MRRRPFTPGTSVRLTKAADWEVQPEWDGQVVTILGAVDFKWAKRPGSRMYSVRENPMVFWAEEDMTEVSLCTRCGAWSEEALASHIGVVCTPCLKRHSARCWFARLIDAFRR